MQREKLFGTDGVRGRAGEGWLTADAVSALGRAAGSVLARSEGGAKRLALTGHDGRRSGPTLEGAVARGLVSAGYEVRSAGLITTPGVATLGRIEGADVAVMISASHNPAPDNGVKIFGANGGKLSDEVEDAIENAFFDDPSPAPEDPVVGSARSGARSPARAVDSALEERYLEHLVGAVPDLALDGMNVVIDCANGGGSRVAPRVLGRLGAHVMSVGAEPDGDNINEGCGATSTGTLQDEVRRLKPEIGIALDGDGDRCILVDEQGQVVHGDGLLTLLARFAASHQRLPGNRIVATVMSNRGLHRALREVGAEVITVGVGDRRVVESMVANGIALGGEQSGHIVFGKDNHWVGDGTYTALRVLEVMRATGAPLSELAAPYIPFPQVLVNVPVSSKPSLSDLPEIAAAVQAIETELGDDGRVLLRYSGTEALARVMVEGPDADRIQAQAGDLARRIAAEIGA